MKNPSQEFTGFDYPITELAKYIRAGDIFTFLLKDRFMYVSVIVPDLYR